MADIPDLISLLCLDAQHSESPFGGKHRTILITKDFTNSGDFVFNNLLQHFSRKEPNTSTLLVTLSHEWTNYSASAAKCGYNLRRIQNKGSIDVLNIMAKVFDTVKNDDKNIDLCNFILESVLSFIEKHSPFDRGDVNSFKPIIVMIDDISILLTLGYTTSEVYRLFSKIEQVLRNRSHQLQARHLNNLIVQTRASYKEEEDELSFLVSNMENLCDLSIALKPLDTGYSTRVDGTIKIVDNRLPAPKQEDSSNTQQLLLTSSLFSANLVDIGMKKAFFYKVGDRRVRLTSSALIF